MDLDKEELKATRINNKTLWTDDSMDYIIQSLVKELERLGTEDE